MISDFIKKMMITHQLSFGEGRFEMMGLRGIILPVQTYVTLIEEMYHESGEAVFDMLFEAGKQQGSLAIEQIGHPHHIAKRRFYNQMQDSFDVMGLGHIEFLRFNPKKGDLEFTIEESPIAEGLKNSAVAEELDRPVDDLQRGNVHAVTEKILGDPVVSRETACTFLGADKCRFVIRAEEGYDEPTEGPRIRDR